MQIEGPVERGIAAADDQDFLSRNSSILRTAVEHRGAFIGSMPGTGGRFGWNEPPPAEITTTLHRTPAGVGLHAKAGSPIFSIVSTISLRWKVGWNGLTCSISASVRAWPVTNGMPDCRRSAFPDRARALAADLVEDVDQMRLHVEEAQFKDGKQSARTRAIISNVGFDRFAHVLLLFG
jgi:hypothetical protein